MRMDIPFLCSSKNYCYFTSPYSYAYGYPAWELSKWAVQRFSPRTRVYGYFLFWRIRKERMDFSSRARAYGFSVNKLLFIP